MEKLSSLSVFFPAYNEEANIEGVLTKALAVLPSVAHQFEVLVVNDGSTDKTNEIVAKLAAKEKTVRLISHKVNQGYGGAIKSGLYNSRFDSIVFNYGDEQFDFSQITKFLPFIEDNDLVIGYRLDRHDPFFRLVNAKLYSLFLFILFGLNVLDVDCGFKLLHKEVLTKISKLESKGALISAELLIKSAKAHLRIKQVGVNHLPRLAGAPTGAKIGVIFRMFSEVFKLYRTLK